MGEWGYAHSKAHISMPEDKRQPSWPTEWDQAVELKEVAVSQTHSYPHKLTALAGTQKATEGHRAGTQNTNVYLNRCPTSLADAAAVIQQPFERPFTRAKRWKQEPLRQWMQLVACSKKFFPNYFFLFHLRQETRTSFWLLQWWLPNLDTDHCYQTWSSSCIFLHAYIVQNGFLEAYATGQSRMVRILQNLSRRFLESTS